MDSRAYAALTPGMETAEELDACTLLVNSQVRAYLLTCLCSNVLVACIDFTDYENQSGSPSEHMYLGKTCTLLSVGQIWMSLCQLATLRDSCAAAMQPLAGVLVTSHA